MLKIQDDLIKKLYKYNMSKFCLTILLDLITISDEKGRVHIYYKDIVSQAGCSEAQFYNVLSNLEEMGLISRCKNMDFRSEIEVTILNNDFSAGYRNYVDIDNVFIVDRLYGAMKAGEIRIYLYVLFRVSKQHRVDSDKLFYNDSYKSISNQLNMTKRMVIRYCKTLDKKGYICVGEKVNIHKKSYDIVTLNKSTTRKAEVLITEKGTKKKRQVSTMFFQWCHYVKNLCRRNKKTFDIQNLYDTATLIGQYRNLALKQRKNIYKVMENAILNFEDYVLDSKLIHHILKNLIELDYNNSIVIF